MEIVSTYLISTSVKLDTAVLFVYIPVLTGFDHVRFL